MERKTIFKTTLAVVAGLIQLVAMPPQVFAQATTGEVIHLTAEEAARMAAANNPDLIAAGYDPRISAERVAQARAAYLPTLQSAFQRNVANSPPSSILSGTAPVRTDIWTGNVGVAQRVPWGGGNYSLGWASTRTNSTFTINNFNPSVTGQIEGSVSQPLLRDFKIDALRGQITIAQRNTDIADIGVRELSDTLTANAQRAYWNLVLARAAVDVQQHSLDLSLELERNNKARVDVGQSPPLDLVSARAEVAQRREALIVSQTQVREAEDQLRVLILDPKRPDYWYVHIEPTDLAPAVGLAPDVDAAVRTALSQRTDLERVRKQTEINDVNLALAKNAIMPDFRLQAQYLTNGLGGNELIRTGDTFPGVITGQSPVAFGDVLRQLFVANYPTWTVGFTLNYPLGRSADEANLARTRLENEQTATRLRSSEFKVVQEVRQAAMQLDQNRQRIETTRLARELEEQRLDAEQKRYDVGMSTNFNVIQAQRDLAVARNDELQAQLDYQLAAINFDTVQKVGNTAGSTAVTGTASGTTTLTIPTTATGTTTGTTTGTSATPTGTTTTTTTAPTTAGGGGGGGGGQ